MSNGGRQTTFNICKLSKDINRLVSLERVRFSLTFADRWEFIVETGLQAGSGGGSHQQMIGVTGVFDVGAHLEAVIGHHGGVGRLFGSATGLGLMLADEIEHGVAIGVAPEPALGAIETGTVLITAWMVPEGDGDLLPIHPFPGVSVLTITHRSHPIL